MRLPIFRYVKNCFNPLVGGRPLSPGKGRYRCLANASQIRRLRALAGAETRDLTGLLTASGRTLNRPVRSNEKAAAGDPFPGFGFQYQTSVLRECIYSCPAFAGGFLFHIIPSADGRRHITCKAWAQEIPVLQNKKSRPNPAQLYKSMLQELLTQNRADTSKPA